MKQKYLLQFFFNNLIKTYLIFTWSFISYKIIKIFLIEALNKKNIKIVKRETLPLIKNVIVILITSISLYIIFLTWEIDLTAWFASAGIIGIAISFAAKDTLANLFSGFFIIIDAPYKIGDFIKISETEKGIVSEIGIRSTRIKKSSNVEIIIPNSIIASSKIVNEYSGRKKEYLITNLVGVSYNSDFKKVEKIILEILSRNEGVLKTPKPFIRLTTFGPSSLDISVYSYIEDPFKRGSTSHNINVEILKEFRKENIDIPFPQMDINLKK